MRVRACTECVGGVARDGTSRRDRSGQAAKCSKSRLIIQEREREKGGGTLLNSSWPLGRQEYQIKASNK